LDLHYDAIPDRVREFDEGAEQLEEAIHRPETATLYNVFRNPAACRERSIVRQPR